jgi:hypothetical protein
LNIRRIAGFAYATFTAVVVGFQIALALGAPWGSYAMGGAFPGQLPPALRVSAAIQAVIFLAFAAIVLSRSGIAFPRLVRASRWLAWVVVAVSALSLILNLITPSPGERAIWAPVAVVLLASSLVVATGPLPATTDA